MMDFNRRKVLSLLSDSQMEDFTDAIEDMHHEDWEAVSEHMNRIEWMAVAKGCTFHEAHVMRNLVFDALLDFRGGDADGLE